LREIEGIYVVEGRGIYPHNSYFINGFLIDCGHPSYELLSDKVSHILITHSHPEHIEDLEKFRGKALILAHKDEIPYAKHPEDGEKINGFEIIHTPGHTKGHLCFYLEDRKILFSGDMVLALTTTVILPPSGDMGEYIKSLEKLLSYEIKMILPAHGPPIKEPERRIRELIEHRLSREREILSLIEEGVDETERLVEKIYGELPEFEMKLARKQVLAHLIKLEREGRIGRELFLKLTKNAKI